MSSNTHLDAVGIPADSNQGKVTLEVERPVRSAANASKSVPNSIVQYIDYVDTCKFTELRFTVPVRIVSEANNREHWAVARNRKVSQKQEIFVAMHNLFRDHGFIFPVHVTLTRIGPKLLDTDNLANGFKAVQDQVAKSLGVDDGDRSKISWSYEQEAIGKREYSVRVEIKSISGASLSV